MQSAAPSPFEVSPVSIGFSTKQLLVIVLLATLAAIFVVPVASKYIPGAGK